MSLRRVRRRSRITITSLIDVIFLLLLFFMLASTFSKFSEVELTSASGDASNTSPDHNSLNLRIDEHHIRLNEEIVPLRRLSEVIGARAKAHPVTLLVTISSETVSTQRMTDVLTVLNGIPDTSLNVLEPDR